MPIKMRKPKPEIDPTTGMAHEIGPTAVTRRALFLIICFGFAGVGIRKASDNCTKDPEPLVNP